MNQIFALTKIIVDEEGRRASSGAGDWWKEDEEARI